MKTFQIIQSLKKQGYKVSFYKRKDGGYLIKSIGHQKFTGAKGNIQARAIVGVNLSQARTFQLERLNKSIRKIKTPLSPALKSKIARVQRIWRKTHTTAKGTIKTSSIRYQVETYGEEEAFDKFEKAERYALGYAYSENISFLKERIQQLAKNEDDVSSDFEEMLETFDDDDFIMNFKEEWIQKINEIVYEAEKGTLDIQEATRRINSIIR